MHFNNIHNNKKYNFEKLQLVNSELKDFVFKNEHGTLTIDFANSNAVIALNKALLMYHYNLQDWQLPKGYLCPPVPSRVDYIHYIADIINTSSKKITGIDIGVGANAIYSILGAQVYHWNMIGSDIHLESVLAAKNNISLTPALHDKITIIHQTNKANIFEGIIKENDFFDFTMCNPPFHSSEKEAIKGTSRKIQNLQIKKMELNFGGQSNELWCNGGEALFIKRMIKESTIFKKQVGYFTSLISKKENILKIKKQLTKLKASFKIIPMEHGNKKTRIIVWSFIHVI